MPIFPPKPDDLRPDENRATGWLNAIAHNHHWELFLVLGIPGILVGIVLLFRVLQEPPNAMSRDLAWKLYRDTNCKVARAATASSVSFACSDGKTYTTSTRDTPPTDWQPAK